MGEDYQATLCLTLIGGRIIAKKIKIILQELKKSGIVEFIEKKD